MAKPKRKGSSAGADYSKEVEEIRRLQDLNRILKAGDIENALLSNSAKDSETLPDNVLDSLLEKANIEERGNDRGLEVIERLTTSGGGGAYRITTERSYKVKKTKGKAKLVRRIKATKKTVSKSAKKRRR